MGNKITRRCSTVDERYTRPQGLYPQRDVDQKKLRRLILDSKLAPCFPGEDELNSDFEECPICFLCYPSLNRSKCCSKGVCTECYLQMKSPRSSRATQCPFCKSHNYTVEFRGVKSQEEKTIEAAEEQKVLEAKIRMRKQELLDDEEREQRQKENRRQEDGPDNTPGTPIVELEDSSPLVDPPESCNSHTELTETPQQESVISGLSNSSNDALDSTRVREESDSEGSSVSIISAPQQPVLTLSPPSYHLMESVTSQHQPRSALSGYARHREDEFDFDLEDIMVMEAIWQSIQEQGTSPGFTGSTLVQTASNVVVPEFGVRADTASISQAQSLPSGSEYQYPRMPGGLAAAIAALAERHAIKADLVFESLQRASTAQAEVATSSCAAAMNTPVMGRAIKPATDVPSMLPQTFEEQMMLAMALSITDAQSRARLEESHPRPLPNVS